MSVIILSVDDPLTAAADDLTPGTEAWARELVAQRFVVQWPIESAIAVSGGCVGLLEGEALSSGDFFALCSFRHATSTQMTQGASPRLEHRGYAMVKLWSPAINAGRMDASKLADAARRVFTRVELTSSGTTPGVVIRPSASQSAIDGRYFMQLLTFPLTWWSQE